MGRHSKPNSSAYRKKRKLQKRRKKKTLKNAHSEESQLLEAKQNQSLICESTKGITADNTEQYKHTQRSSTSLAKTDDESSVQSDNTNRSPFSLSESEFTMFVKNKQGKKQNKKDVIDQDSEPYLRDPLYVKWQEYKLLSSRIHRLKIHF
jgi:hypothetical protein